MSLLFFWYPKVEKMGKNVDALLVVNNERLRKIYPDLSMINAFKKVDNTLTNAAKSIAEIITLPGIINLDFADVHTTMKDGGVALMSNGYGEGENRLEKAIEEAFLSPLLNSNNVFTARKILFNISFSPEAEIKMDELDFVNDLMARFDSLIDVIWGTAVDESLGQKVKFTVLATGFGLDDIPEIEETRKNLIDVYYGDIDGRIPLSPVSPASIVILTMEEMDNEQIITMLEDNPTYNRDANLIKQTRAKIAKEFAGDFFEEASEETNSGSKRPTIRFN
jgi:cell division protein FtsZ